MFIALFLHPLEVRKNSLEKKDNHSNFLSYNMLKVRLQVQLIHDNFEKLHLKIRESLNIIKKSTLNIRP